MQNLYRKQYNKLKITHELKKNHKDVIISAGQISFEQFEELNKINSSDPYLKCKTKSEQKLINNLNIRLVKETKEKIKMNKHDREDKVTYKLIKYKIQEQSYIDETKNYKV